MRGSRETCRPHKPLDLEGSVGVVSFMPRTTRKENTVYVVEVWNGKRWAKVRGYEGGPFKFEGRAERMATLREAAPSRGLSSTEGMPHRVVERSA